MLQEVKMAFLECNREQLDYFAREIELGTGVRVMPVLIDNLDTGQESAGIVKEADLIVTTFFHLDEVRSRFRSDREHSGHSPDRLLSL